MTNSISRKVLVGAGLLSALVAGSFSSAAQARPSRDDVKEQRKDVKEARKEVRKERKDLHKADTRDERREGREELRDANQKLRRESWEYQREKARRDGKYNGGSRGNYNNGNRYGNNNGYNNNGNYRPNNGNGYNNNGHYRPNNGNGYYNNGSDTNQGRRMIREGVVTADTRGDSFILRARNGQTFRVIVSGREPRRLNRGDTVRIEGFDNGSSTFRASKVDILRNR